MSAAGRGAERKANDLYETPSWLTEAILPHLGDPKTIYEPACGKHAILNVLEAKFKTATFFHNDLHPQIEDWCLPQDFLKCQVKGQLDLLITNPPYGLAFEFAKKAMEIRAVTGCVVVLLLRLNFLGSQGRAAWLRDHTPSIYVSPRRPSFTGGGTDATEYAWFMWDEKPPTVTILKTEAIGGIA